MLTSARWLRWAAAIGVLAAAVALGLVAGRWGARYWFAPLVLAILPFGVLLLEAVVRRPWIGPFLILMSGTLTSFYVSKGITPALMMTGGFAGLWLLGQLIKQRRIDFVRSKATAPTLAFIAVAIISWPWGNLMADPFLIVWPDIELIQAAQLAVIVLSPMAMLLTASLIKTHTHLRALVYIYMALTTVGLLLNVARAPFGLNMSGLNSTWSASFLWAYVLYYPPQRRWTKLAALVIFGLYLYYYVYLGITWLSGWLPMIVALVVVTVFKSRAGALGLLVVSVLVIIGTLPFWQQQFGTEYNESGGNRLEKWELIFSQPFAQDHLLLGTGPFGYARYFMTYIPWNAASTHNNYIDIILQFGIVGSLVFIWLMAAIFWEGVRLWRSRLQDPFLAAFVCSTLGGFVAVIVAMNLGDWFIPFVLNQGLHGYTWTVHNWIFLGAMLAIPGLLRDSASPAPTLAGLER